MAKAKSDAPKRRGRKSHEPTVKDRNYVKKMAAVGIPHEDIALVIGISADTLTKHYAPELKLGLIEAKVKMGDAIYRNGIQGNATLAIFWMKTRGGWKENMAPPGGDDPAAHEATERIIEAEAMPERYRGT